MPGTQAPATALPEGLSGGVMSSNPASLTGTWVANDGGTYFLRQIGDTLWWLGLSGGLLHPGCSSATSFTPR